MSRLIIVIGLLVAPGLASSLLAQSPPANAHSPEPVTPKGAAPPASSASSPNPSDPSQQKEYQAAFAAMQERIGKASGEVMNRIVKAENDLYIRFSYFKKPERLDPNSFATKDEVASWSKSLEELKNQQAALDRLYANADADLQSALVAQKITPPFAEQIKKQLLKSFPWETIQKKQLLMQDYIGDHGELLAFYEKNWGTWRKGNDPLKPVFDNPKLGASYAKLRDKIISTGKQIDEQFTALRR